MSIGNMKTKDCLISKRLMEMELGEKTILSFEAVIVASSPFSKWTVGRGGGSFDAVLVEYFTPTHELGVGRVS